MPFFVLDMRGLQDENLSYPRGTLVRSESPDKLMRGQVIEDCDELWTLHVMGVASGDVVVSLRIRGSAVSSGPYRGSLIVSNQ